ncbi:hypothetical protein [Streptomyces avicenniae]|uniref:hypothetical protein n=1 Tax=Streptomyces avicenniae TaxID=500153 RepID=UPI00069B8643|nr:hypothetical protein [Streptomyces avicenniae]
MTAPPLAPPGGGAPATGRPAPRVRRHRTGRAETVGYAVAGLILVVGGALLTSVVLNWLVGPAVVVACVAVAGRVGEWRRAR